MMDPSTQRTSTTFWLLIAGSLTLVLLGLALGWSRGLSGLSDHSSRLAVIAGVALFVFYLLIYIIAWHHEDGGGGRKFGSAIVGSTLGVLVVLVGGSILAMVVVAGLMA